jgi:hypothetical protein
LQAPELEPEQKCARPLQKAEVDFSSFQQLTAFHKLKRLKTDSLFITDNG